MKINFKQPKYVIPLIVTPFAIISFFIWGGKMKAEPKQQTTEEVAAGMNTSMPGVDTSIAKGQIKNKFDAYQQAFKNARDLSAVGDIDNRHSIKGLDYTSAYSDDEAAAMTRKKIDSIQRSMQEKNRKINEQFAALQGGSGMEDGSAGNSMEEDPVIKLLRMQQQNRMQEQQNTATGETPTDNLESYQAQMKLFKEQMRFMDSMQRANGGELNPADIAAAKSKGYISKHIDPKSDTTFRPLPISSANNRTAGTFNTIRNIKNDDNSISAMIDQDVKATLGSRVRIRLLKDMYVGDYLVKKGTYIYAVVTGFQKQRVNLSIAQIQYNNASLPVDINVFDNDGYLGLYVPGSNFREFTKEIGTQATQGMSTAVTPDGSDVKMNMLSQVFNTTTTTLAALIKKDKAFLKYNYIVYLKENKKNKDY